MNKCNIGGHDFFYKKINYGPIGGVCVFAIKDAVDAKEYDLYWVVIPVVKDWEKGCSSPKDGHVTCMCKEEIDAKMIAAAINIAHGLSSKVIGLDEFIKNKFKDIEDKYDTDAMAKEVSRLHREGKSDEEILKLMKDKRESFLRKPAEVKKDGGEW